ncbi:hypothetical protein A1O3_05266 [Capronia epimyces CBS 606.96]|uniref:Zn(2)-C6 fungal-type domain-containing protein n=1 Tax=Capronia epimyces CBS 606.96 TaxID=1182542 RepID=W9Y5U7_9EURO|nr:uncharacterized protein A1O3_05266 [Capronia epimyces CBS 606.96]EXJ84596.1 hypothetical protein A1O3_05266 [Capronia epimyces CBS 606.96]
MSALHVEAQRAPAPDADPPRKRRKRAPAAGAADDCFTCATRNLKCDRRRPYCSQCLDDGKDCAGYKTQLTWGNGVASRGKLRGLSLPIAGTQKITTGSLPIKPKRKLSQLQQRISQPRIHKQHESLPGLLNGSSSSNISCKPPDVFHGFPFDQPNGLFPTATHPSTTSWSPAIPSDSSTSTRTQMSPVAATQSTAPSAPPVLSPLGGFSFHPGLPPNVGQSRPNHISPIDHVCSPPGSAYFGRVLSHDSTDAPDSLSSAYPSYTCSYDDNLPMNRQFLVYQRLEPSYTRDGTYTQLLPPQTLDPASEQGDGLGEEVDGDSLDDGCAAAECGAMAGLGIVPLNYSLPLSHFGDTDTPGATPRMQYLIKYYAEVISPVIVAFDGPSNPYRTQILGLAARSETLQHAISALAASNLRQRRETGALSTGKTAPARRSTIAHLTLTKGPLHNMGLLSAEEQAREEFMHKGIAIRSLNKQLADPVLRTDDSILATLLILCLFHICDSGVAKFQTQFAGVKKLLALRKNDLGKETKETKWFTRMFTWFDAMTATVNDREGQLQGHHLDVSARSDEEWALENLAGCDGQLFKTIAKLGRLNVLSQGKSVEKMPILVPRPIPKTPPGLHLDHKNIDGNGWVRLVEDEKLYTIKTADQDIQAQFWREWREIRQTLQTWELDTTTFDSFSPEAPYLTLDQRIDLSNISESFRYAALLYTERLANPTVPSTDARIRTWVQECLTHIKAVKSDVYLLWPLFVTGSECVDDHDRDVIRQRCLDIQKDSGFLNNISCLELLEKVWQRNDDKYKNGKNHSGADIKPGPEGEGGFKFRTIMELEGNEGEYIVV